MRTAALTAQVGTMGATAAATALANRKAITAAVLRTKAKARMRRAAVAVPFVGAGLLVEFERRDFLEWQEDNPEGTMVDYSCEMATISIEIVDEVLQELPEKVRPSRDRVLSWLPECEEPPA